MCEERERLIGYVYDECAADERRVIEAHLESCHTCRREIGGLRKVRQDLLAWEVPEQAPVWRPIAPVVPVSPWASIPAWALTAAAGLLLMVGAAGGAVTYAFLPHSTPQVVQAAAPPVAPLADPSKTAALEQRIAELEKAAATSQTATARNASAELSSVKATVNTLLRRVDDLDDTVTRTTLYTAGVRMEQQRLKNSVNNIWQTSLTGTPTDAPRVGGSR